MIKYIGKCFYGNFIGDIFFFSLLFILVVTNKGGFFSFFGDYFCKIGIF